MAEQGYELGEGANSEALRVRVTESLDGCWSNDGFACGVDEALEQTSVCQTVEDCESDWSWETISNSNADEPPKFVFRHPGESLDKALKRNLTCSEYEEAKARRRARTTINRVAREWDIDLQDSFIAPAERSHSIVEPHGQLGDWMAAEPEHEKIPIFSLVNPNLRWYIAEKAGKVECSSVEEVTDCIPAQANNVPGPSDQATYYASDETRPQKRLSLMKFMNVETLQYVDLELFCHLKRINLATGTTKTTHAKLHQAAHGFMQQYRINHLEPSVLLQVLHWTVLAAMVPLPMELEALQLLAQPGIWNNMNQLTTFRQKGKIWYRKPLAWWKCFGKPQWGVLGFQEN